MTWHFSSGLELFSLTDLSSSLTWIDSRGLEMCYSEETLFMLMLRSSCRSDGLVNGTLLVSATELGSEIMLSIDPYFCKERSSTSAIQDGAELPLSFPILVRSALNLCKAWTWGFTDESKLKS